MSSTLEDHVKALAVVLCQLRDVPVGPVEPGDILVNAPEPLLLASCSISAPRGVSANDVIITPLPKRTRAGVCVAVGVKLADRFIDEVGAGGVPGSIHKLQRHIRAFMRALGR